jgi:hypothetical protein
MTRFSQYLTTKGHAPFSTRPTTHLCNIPSRQTACDTSPPRSLFPQTSGLDHQVYESPSSNPLEHLTETLETSRIRHGFLTIFPRITASSFGTLETVSLFRKATSCLLDAEKRLAKTKLHSVVCGHDARRKPHETAHGVGLSTSSARLGKAQDTRLGNIRDGAGGESEGKRYNFLPSVGRAPLCGVDHLQVPIAVVRGYRTIQLYGVSSCQYNYQIVSVTCHGWNREGKRTNEKQTTVAFARRESYHWLVILP